MLETAKKFSICCTLFWLLVWRFNHPKNVLVKHDPLWYRNRCSSTKLVISFFLSWKNTQFSAKLHLAGRCLMMMMTHVVDMCVCGVHETKECVCGFLWIWVTFLSDYQCLQSVFFFFSVANFCILLTPISEMRGFCHTFPDVCREKFWSTFCGGKCFLREISFHHISTEFLVWWQFFTSFFSLNVWTIS